MNIDTRELEAAVVPLPAPRPVAQPWLESPLLAPAPVLPVAEVAVRHEDARALVEAGFMPLAHYLELGRQCGWAPDGDASAPARSDAPERA